MTPLSFQLYSARNYPLADVLPMLARIGYGQVEGFGGLGPAGGPDLPGGVYADAAGLRASLDRLGLAMPTGHMELDLLARPDLALAAAKTLGLTTVVCPWLAPDQRPSDAAGWLAFGEQLAALARPFQAAGLTFAYHNHDFEFAPLPDGRFPIDLVLATAPDIAVEADIAWMFRCKADAFAWLQANGNRIVAIHIKDMASEGENLDEEGWADVGYGILPWERLMRTVRDQTRARFFVLEHDDPSDIGRFAKRSYAAVRQLGLPPRRKGL